MKRALLLTLAALTLLAFALPARQAQAATSIGFSISTGGRHNGFSLSFQSRPSMVVIPASRVYYDPDLDQDLYCYGDDWYYVDDGAWYTSRSYRGPFLSIAFASVPYEVRNVPVGYRRHWGGGYATSSYGTGYRDGQWYDRSQTQVRDRSWNDRSWTQARDWGWSDRNHGRGRGNRGGNGHGRWNRG